MEGKKYKIVGYIIPDNDSSMRQLDSSNPILWVDSWEEAEDVLNKLHFEHYMFSLIERSFK